MDLPLPQGGFISNIFHISDIHIRKGDFKNARSEEYDAVFQRIVYFIQNSPFLKTSCVVITGDVFDTKDVLNSLATNLLLSFLSNLSKLLPVYIIKGNHDYKQDNAELPDLLSFLNIINIPNIVYLDSIGYYYAGDIGFALMPIQYTLSMQCAVGRSEKMPDFPLASQMRQGIKKRIALFHGTVPSHKLTLQWFGDGYDFIMLGDLHTQSIVSNGHVTNNDINIASLKQVEKDVYLVNTVSKTYKEAALCMYPGSTIQQNFGEDILGHGLLQWDLTTDTVSMLHVKNDFGKLYTSFLDGKWKFLISHFGGRQYIDIEDCVNINWFPKKLHVTVKNISNQFDSIHSLENKIQQLFDSNSIITKNVSTITFNNHNEIGNEFALEMKYLSSLNTPTEWKQFIENKLLENNLVLPWKNWQTIIDNPELIKLLYQVPEIQTSIDKRNKGLSLLIDDYKQVQNQIKSFKPKTLKISNVSWDWVLCYGPNCSLDLDTLENKVVCINAPNGYGKSSCKEIIYIALFGEGFPSKDPKKGLVCQQKPANEIPKTIIDFFIDGTKYKLTRILKLPTDVKIKSDRKSITLIEFDNKQVKNTIYGSTATAWIKKNLGESKEFLASCMLTQDGANDFFALDSKQQIDKLEKVLNLQSTTIFKNILHEGYLSFKAIKNDLLTVHKVLESQEDFNFDIEHHKNVGTNLEAITSDLFLMKQSVAQINTLLNDVDKELLGKGHTFLCNLYKEKQESLNILKHQVKDSNLEELFKRHGHYESQLQIYNINCFDKSIHQVEQSLKDFENIPHPEKYCHSNVVSHEIASLDNDLKIGCKSLDIHQTQDVHSKCQHLLNLISSLSSSINHLEIESNSLHLNKQNITLSIDALLTNPSYKPRSTIEEYQQWNEKITAFRDKWGNLEMLESKIEALKHFGDISEKQKTIAEWILKAERISGIKNILNNKSKLDIKVKNLSSEVKKQSVICQQLKDQVVYKASYNDALEQQIKQNHELLIKHLENKPSFILKYQDNQEQTEIDYTIFLENYKKVFDQQCDTYDVERDKWIVENGPRYFQEYIITSNLLDTNKNLLQTCKHDFNPDCISCQTHPWRVQASRIEQENEHLQKQLDNHTKVMFNKCGTLLNDSEIVQANQRYLCFKDKLFWDEYLKEKAIYSNWNNTKTEIMMLRSELNSKQLIIEKETISLQKQLDSAEESLCLANKVVQDLVEIQNTFNLIQNEYEASKYWQLYIDFKKLQDQEDYWKNELILINKYQVWHTNCLNSKKELEQCNVALTSILKDLQNKSNSLQHAYEQLDLCKQLVSYVDKLEYLKKIQKKLELQNYLHAYTIHINLQNTLAEISSLKAIDELTLELDNISKALKHLDDYNHLITIQGEVNDLEKTKNNMLIVKGNLDLNFKRHIVLIEKYQQISDIILEIEQRSESLYLIEGYFAEFKTWVIEKKAIPMICKHVNAFLANLCKNHRPLYLSATLPETNIINWEVIDGNCKPLLQRASGFERFVISLAMRVTLSKIGGVNIASKQLFIDEGFTACDTSNLKSIPDFLDSLLSIYDTILVVTHLDQLKDNIKYNLSITRDQGISKLVQFV